MITGFFAWQGVTLLGFLEGSVDPGTRSAMVLAGVGRGSTTVLAAFGILILALCVMTAVLGLGLFARREWAREGAMFVFGAFGGIVLVLSIGGLLSGSADAPAGAAIGLADLAVAGLLLTGGVADDFDARSKAREHT